MAVVIHLVQDIFDPSTSHSWDIDPNKLVWSNASISAGAGWNLRSNVTVFDGVSHYTYDHAYCVSISHGETAIPGRINITFANAAISRSSPSVRSNLTLTFRDIKFYNAESSQCECAFITLSDTNTSNYPGFWINSLIVSNSLYKCAGEAFIDISVSAGGTFAYPFLDLDSTLDAKADSTTPGNPYTESITVSSNSCSAIYGLSGGHPNGTWLYLHANGANLELATQDGTAHINDVRFDNGWAETDSTGTHTGVVGIFESVATIKWTGSACGTSLKGEGHAIKHKITYHGNPVISGQSVTNVPDPQYKEAGVDITVTDMIPVHSVPNSNTQVEFRGWATSASGSPSYAPPRAASSLGLPSTISDDTITNLYARWRIKYRVTFDAHSSRGSGADTNVGYIVDVTHSIIAHTASQFYEANTRPVFPSDWRVKQLGYNATGWSTTNDGTKDYDISAQLATLTGPTNYYATFSIKTYTVTFHDGFNSGNSGIISKVDVQYDKGVPQSSIPVSGQTYTYYDGESRKFKKPGFYTFAGWSGSLDKIKDNIDVYAMWEFIPIWVMTNGQWVKYDPVEI